MASCSSEVLEELGELSEAELLYRRCIETIERTLGKEHPDRWTAAGPEFFFRQQALKKFGPKRGLRFFP
jgi:hypothetical protein